MQFSIIALFSLVALAAAGSDNVRRQNSVSGGVPVGQPAMTDASGNVIPFDAASVYQDAKAKGL